MRCQQCGRDLPADAKFCLECGAPQPPAPSGEAASPSGSDAARPGQASDSDALEATRFSSAEKDGARSAALEKTQVAASASGPGGQTSVDVPDTSGTSATAPSGETASPSGSEGAGSGQASDSDAPEAPRFSSAEKDDAWADATVLASQNPTARLASAAPATVRAGETTALDDAWRATAPQPRPAPAPREEAPEPSSSGRLGLIAAIVVFLAAAGLLAAFVTWRLELWGGVTLPNVVGLPAQEAQSALEDAGFQTATNDVVSDDQVGRVVSQSPEAGRREERGTVVALGVGVERRVPLVVGQPLEQARDALRQLEISHVRLEYENSDQDEGTVISVSPAEGTVVSADDMVTLVVAQPYTVPDVTGLSADDAVAAVEKSGLSAKVTYVTSDKPQGTAVSTTPVAGTTLKEGETVTVNVSSPYPSSLYAAAEYLSTKPEDLSTYLREQGYRMAYGSSENGAATMVWEGAAADPVVTIGPNPFKQYGGFQFWATDALAAGAQVKGVRLEFSQANAPADVTLKVDQVCVTALMNACGLTSSADTTTTAVPSTVVPAVSGSASFVVKAGTQQGRSWAVAVWQDQRGDLTAAVCVAPTDSLKEALDADGMALSGYGDSLANLAATQLCVEGR